ncbi:phage tail protein [Achromobacter spanius]|uniref:phage tail protein n=1 Tax=Achromobacter spanius TaxID=217203 RepID=UPI003207AE55
MQTLDPINVGQEPNDGTGDPHRAAFQKVNANFGKVVEGIGEVGTAAQEAADAAQAAGQVAADAIPFDAVGAAGGVAPLDAGGKVPGEYLPEQEEFIPMAQKGAAEGVATLGADGKVTPDQLPNAVDAIPLTEKGAAGGVATLDAGGLVPEDQLPPIPSGPAVGTPDFWPLRSSIPAGQIPQDGQTVSRAAYPDLTAMVLAGTLPVVAEATWQSTPTERGKYTPGDGSTTIRIPDLNGKSAGSLGAVVWRGDGSLSAGTGGVIQRDAFQGHRHGPIRIVGQGITSGGVTMNNVTGSGPFVGADLVGEAQPDGVNGNPRTAVETRGLNVTGVWTVHAFGAVVNPGSVDAAQLASDLAVLNAAVQTLQGQMGHAFGVSQTLQDVTASRALDTVYTNSTDRPISVYVRTSSSASTAYIILFMDQSPISIATYTPGTTTGLSITGVIPPGASYRAAAVSTTLVSWKEYR